ncbi:LytR/AlgR family response regulator transcription factor [Halpernia sp. GG3]
MRLKRETYFFIKCDGQLVRINFSEILYIESIKDYVNIKTENKEYIYLETLKSLETQLPHNFQRIHKSYILNTDKILKVGSNFVSLISKKDIPLGESSRSQFFSKLK